MRLLSGMRSWRLSKADNTACPHPRLLARQAICTRAREFWYEMAAMQKTSIDAKQTLDAAAMLAGAPEANPGGAPERCCPVRINLSAQGGANPLLLKTLRLSGEARNWVKSLAAPRSAALVAAPAVQVECSGSCNSSGKGPTNS